MGYVKKVGEVQHSPKDVKECCRMKRRNRKEEEMKREYAFFVGKRKEKKIQASEEK